MQNTKAFHFEEALARLREAIAFVNLQVVDRVDVIDQIFVALLMREHVLLESRTGAAKSLLARQVFAMFGGAALFQVQASKEQQPDTYFGGLDIEQLKKGRMVHNTTDSIVESEFAFIDEIFDANDYTLRALLTTLNERALVLGAQQQPAKLHTAVAATNYLRVSEITEALLDRFLFKSMVIPAKTPAVQYHIARRYMAHGGRPVQPPQRIPYEELAAMSAVVKGEDPWHEIRVPAEVIFFSNAVVRYYEMQRNRLIAEKPHEHPHRKDFYISPRSYARGMDLLRAIAFLHGRDEATADDVGRMWYMHTIVGMQEQRELFRKSHETMLQQLGAGKGFEQIRTLLDFQDLLDHLEAHPEDLQRPVTEIEGTPLRRTLKEWAKETLGISDATVEQNRRLLEGFLASVAPQNEEIHELRQQMERQLRELLHPAAHLWD